MLLKNDIEKFKNIVNKTNVLTDREELYCYAEDAANINHILPGPEAVVFVESVEQVQKILAYANKNRIPIVSRGAGTNMVGACTCPKGGIVLNFSKMNKILDFNPVDLTMKVQPGVTIGEIKSLAEEYGLFYPPDPSNYRVSTIGGSIAQSSGGAMGFKYGTTKDYILSLTVVLADGSIMKLGKGTIKDACGYHLNQLIVGSEGTLGIVVEAVLKLIPQPEAKRTILTYFDSFRDTVCAVNEIIKSKIFPCTIDFMDKNSINTVEKFYPTGLKIDKEALLLIDIDGFESSMEQQIELITSALKKANASDITIAQTKEEQIAVWTARQSSFASAAQLGPDVLSDDIIVPRSKILEMISGCRDICDKFGLTVCIVGHLGDGNIHPQVVLNTENHEEMEKYYSAKKEIYELVYTLDGTISAEHGIGSDKIEFLPKIIDNHSIDYMKKIKQVFDPNGILNPDKVFKI